jgi:hypothetical protein
MSKETKFGYGFWFAGVGVPYLMDKLFGQVPAFWCAILFTIFGAVLLVAGHQHREKNEPPLSPRKRISGYAVLIILLAGLIVGIVRFRPKALEGGVAQRAEPSVPAATPNLDTFAITLRKVHQHMTQTLNGQTGEFWVVEKGANKNETLYPIPLMAWLDITNVGPSSETVRSYQASVQTQECGWITLYPLYMGSKAQIYYAGMTFRNAVAMDFSERNLQTILGKDIQTSSSISGWLFFYATVACPMLEGEKATFRLVVDTYGKKHQEFISEEQTIIDERSARPSPVGVTRPIEYRLGRAGKRDISRIPRRNFVSSEMLVPTDKSDRRATETPIPQRWKIPGNRFSEMPTTELCSQSRGLAARTRKDQEDTSNAVIKSNDDHLNALQQPNLTESRRQLLEEDAETQRNVIRAKLDQRYLFSYKPDGIQLLRALEKRVPAGTMPHGEIDSYERFGEQRPVLIESIAISLVQAADALCPAMKAQ